MFFILMSMLESIGTFFKITLSLSANRLRRSTSDENQIFTNLSEYNFIYFIQR